MTVIPVQIKQRKNLISLTPLIDVVFILLIFFMLTSAYIDHRVVELPILNASDNRAENTQPPNILRLSISPDTINITDNNTKSQLITSDALASLLQREYKSSELTVIVTPEPGTPMQRVIALLDILAIHNVTSVQFEEASADGDIQ